MDGRRRRDGAGGQDLRHRRLRPVGAGVHPDRPRHRHAPARDRPVGGPRRGRAGRRRAGRPRRAAAARRRRGPDGPLRRGQPPPHRRRRPRPHAADGRAGQHRPSAAGRHRGAPGRPARAGSPARSSTSSTRSPPPATTSCSACPGRCSPRTSPAHRATPSSAAPTCSAPGSCSTSWMVTCAAPPTWPPSSRQQYGNDKEDAGVLEQEQPAQSHLRPGQWPDQHARRGPRLLPRADHRDGGTPDGGRAAARLRRRPHGHTWAAPVERRPRPAPLDRAAGLRGEHRRAVAVRRDGHHDGRGCAPAQRRGGRAVSLRRHRARAPDTRRPGPARRRGRPLRPARRP